MMSSNNILSPATAIPSSPVAGRGARVVLHDREKVGAKGEGMAFSDVAEVHRAYESRHCDLQAKVKVRLPNTPRSFGQAGAERSGV